MSVWMDKLLEKADKASAELRGTIHAHWAMHGPATEALSDLIGEIPSIAKTYGPEKTRAVWGVDIRTRPELATNVVEALTRIEGAGYTWDPSRSWDPVSLTARGVQVSLRGVGSGTLFTTLATLLAPLEAPMLERRRLASLPKPEEDVA